MRAHDHPGSRTAGVLPIVGLVATLVVARLAAAATIGLIPDELYYWVWSRNLALSYFDHPPAVAYFIRLSTWIGGDGPLGVRWLAVLLSGIVSVGVYRLAGRLYDDAQIGLAAAALLQATLFIAFGSLFVTPDTTLLLFWLLALLAAAEVWRTGRGLWWLAVGAAVGLAFLSKYTALFLGFGLLAWLIIAPEMRGWLRSPWPYAGGALAGVLSLPVLIWNARHDWASFGKQFGRAVPASLDAHYLPEFLAGQMLLLTPLVAVLVLWGLRITLRDVKAQRSAPNTLLVATTLPLLIYFLYHSLFARVEGNWTAPLVPALAIMAAAASVQPPSAASVARTLLRFSSRWAVPCGVTMALVVLLHAAFQLIHVERDPLARTAGWADLVREAERLADQRGAGTLASISYQVASALRYFGRGDRPAVQLAQRIRYVMEPKPDVASIAGRPVLIVAEPRYACLALAGAEQTFLHVAPVQLLERKWKGKAVEVYATIVASEPRQPGLPDLTIARASRAIDCGRLRELRR